MSKENIVFSQKSPVIYHLQSDFHPIVILLFAFGINVKKNTQKSCIFLATFFHVVWILIFINAVACFDKADVTYHIFTMIKNSCALFTWWILYKKRKELAHLINSVKRLQDALKRGCNVKMQKWIYVASAFSVFVVFGPGVICCIKLLIEDEYPLFFCSHHQSAMTQKDKARILHFWLLSGSNYASRGISYIVVIFYSFYCMELKRLSKCLENNAKRWLNPSSPEIDKMLNRDSFLCPDHMKTGYLKIVKLLMEFEDAFSSVVFLQFVSSFLEILRIETVVFMYLKGRWKFDIIVHSLYWSFVGAFSFLAMILSADSVQDSCHAAGIALQDSRSTFSSETVLKSLQLQMEHLQNVRFIRLTAWGMFQIKKDLFLSIIALYVSYGVLIAQMTP